MEQSKIDRINELAKKSKTPEGLTEEEKSEQYRLRQEYIAEWRRSTEQTLENIIVVDEQGNQHPLKKK